MPPSVAPPRHVTFDWRIYAEATCAGLTALVPIPLIDLAFETYFRRRMPGTIARVRGRALAADPRRRFGRDTGRILSLEGCLTLPLSLGRYVLRKLWRKVIYVFAIADAASSVSAYWHRAYLLDHVIRAGHAAPDVDWRRSAAVFDAVLGDTDPSPLMGLARQTVSNAHRVLRLLIRARRRGAAAATESISNILRSHWDGAEASLVDVALRYNDEYARSLEVDPPRDRDRQPG
jgi:hypothetical protein